jgi:hypothetical protein
LIAEIDVPGVPGRHYRTKVLMSGLRIKWVRQAVNNIDAMGNQDAVADTHCGPRPDS